jgi:hypothetical protein
MLSRALEIFHNGAMGYMECYQDEDEYEYGLMHRGIYALERHVSDLTDDRCCSISTTIFPTDRDHKVLNHFTLYHDLTICPYTLPQLALSSAKSLSNRLSRSRCRKR